MNRRRPAAASIDLVIAYVTWFSGGEFEEQRVSVHAEGSWDLEEQIVQKKIKRIGKGAYIDLEVHCVSVSAYRNAYERPPNNTN